VNSLVRLKIRRGAFCLLIASTVACGSKANPSPGRAPDREETTRSSLKEVVLPDLSNASPQVQSQIRERYGMLTATIQQPGTPTADLVDAYGGMGKLFLAAEYFDAAEVSFRHAQILAPADMRWPYYLAQVSRFKNELAKAADRFEEALRLKPDDVPTLAWLGEVRLAENKPEQAEPLFARARALQPGSSVPWYGLGRVALAAQDFDRAAAELEQALALDPAASRIHYPLALAYRGRGDRAKAEAQLKLRGDVEPKPADALMAEVSGLLRNESAYEARAAEALDKRQWPQAVVNLKQAIAAAPNNAFTRLNLGTALYLSGDVRGAREQYEAAIRLSPQLPKAHYGLGVLMAVDGHDREAIQHFSAAVRAEPAYVEARMQLADALRRSGSVKESLPHYDEIIRTNPGISQAVFGRAMALVRLDRHREARDELNRGMTSYPDQAGFAHALARLLAASPDESVRDGSRAMALVQRLLQQQHTLALAETMAMTRAELGEFDEAVRSQQEAIAMARQTGREDVAGRLRENLARYEQHQPCRTPWRADDPVFHPAPAP